MTKMSMALRHGEPFAGAGLALVLAVLTVLVPRSLAADDLSSAADRYDIEFIIFQRTASIAVAPEIPGVPGVMATDGNRQPQAAPSPTSLAPEQLRLAGAAAALRRGPNSRVIYHGGWSQTLGGATSAVPSALPEKAREAGAEGTLTVWKERFLHAEVAIALPAPAGASGENAVIRQGRRLRSGELHYFDSPAVGVILSMRPSAASTTTSAPTR